MHLQSFSDTARAVENGEVGYRLPNRSGYRLLEVCFWNWEVVLKQVRRLAAIFAGAGGVLSLLYA